MLPSIKAVLFDFDGTLGKTMEDNLAAWQHTLRPYGVELAAEDYLHLEGLPLKEMVHLFFERAGKPTPDAQELIRQKDDWYRQHNQFALYEGTIPVLEHLKEYGLLLGIVTAGHSGRITRSAGESFLKLFDTVVTGDMYEIGKPHPDPYLSAARAIAQPSEVCVVVENAPLGIQSAKAAGMYCVGVTTTLSAEMLTQADELIPTVGQLLESNIFRKSFNRSGEHGE